MSIEIETQESYVLGRSLNVLAAAIYLVDTMAFRRIIYSEVFDMAL